MDQGVGTFLKMIEQNGASLAKKAELCKDTMPELITETAEFYSLYRSLVERYDHLNDKLNKNLPLDLQMQDSFSAPHSPMATPDQKPGLNKLGQQGEPPSSGQTCSDLSLKDYSDSSSPPLSDSESESLNSSGNAYYSLPMNTDHKKLHQKIVELGTEFPKMEGKLELHSEDEGDCVFVAQGNENYEELLGRIMSYEEELRDSKLKLKLSEEEVARLKNELEKSESFVVLAETLQGQLESANQSIRMREADLEVERRRTMELKGMANEMESRLKSAGEEIVMLKSKLESESDKCLNLLERFSIVENDLLEREKEVKALKRAEENFLAENSHLQSTISSLLERNSFLEVRIGELESHNKYLEENLRQCEAEEIEVQLSHDTQINELQEEISQLKIELGEDSEHIEILNKQVDYFKFKYDMLEAEKDTMSAKVSKLHAEMSSNENRIGQMEENLRQEKMKNAELVAASRSFEKQVEDMRMRIAELEREVDKQRGELFDGAEEKREAIRQLCFSLEHYRSGYKELCRAFVQHKRHLIASS